MKEFIMSLTNIIEQFEPLICAILSIVSSIVICKINNKQEQKKLSFQFANSKNIAKAKFFSEMMTSVDRYCVTKNNIERTNSLKAVSSYIPFASQNVIPLLKDLDNQITNSEFLKIRETRTKILDMVSLESDS